MNTETARLCDMIIAWWKANCISTYEKVGGDYYRMPEPPHVSTALMLRREFPDETQKGVRKNG